MVETSKQVRVDNWGIFFLQRLQMFFSKTDYCDLTLQFEGNVQLKVHRLVMNACTEYFTFLEQTCPALEESTIMMPTDLQADVIVPIVNFMYTGMLEFHMAIFEKLYKAAELMNITVLTKLLDAQKSTQQGLKPVKKKTDVPHAWSTPAKKVSTKTSSTPDLPATLPGRKLPVWKRKNVPVVPMQHPTSQLHFSEQKWSQDPLCVPDNTPKPTRFEWPDDDLPPMNLMDTSFEEISYTSKPLLTQEEEARAGPSFDEVRNNANSNQSSQSKKGSAKSSSGGINMKEVEDYVKEQKIRVDFEEGEEYSEFGQKRKLEQNSTKSSPKRLKTNDKENKETTISIKSSNGADLDHTLIVSKLLQKYPDLVKKNKNIRLKIMASGHKNIPEQKVHTPVKTPKMKVEAGNKSKPVQPAPKIKQEKQKFNIEGPWTCDKCEEAGETPQEFVLYYLYRKHMTDVHYEVFDVRLCKYCGRKCGKHNLMMYHLYTKHGLKPPASYNFPKCDQCPHIALSADKLTQHKLQHGPNEMQCVSCKLAFTNQQCLTGHIQITGHFNKAGISSFDCQYCAKKLQSAINLFSHIKNSHLKEARRDGIVSLDELDDVEDMDDEDEDQVEEEYIVPEILPDAAMHKDKVKIISNVKVPGRSDQRANDSQQQSVLEPSSEAEALNNVASGIATSLGLVDIVVLDENQQYILQQQESQGGQQEYILPELTTGENPFAGQVITTQHSTGLPQGMLQSSGSDIGSTDELVMVLTDHDYQDEQEGGNTDNSNIVVLYSHPVDGQQGQFITSQGNLLVNSQTGMLEIRNGASIATTTANQMAVTNSVDTPIESIEMIQREIESHSELKQEPFYEEDRKPNIVQVHQDQREENVNQEPEEQIVQHEEIAENRENDQETPNESLEEENRTSAEDSGEIVQEDAIENQEVQNLEQGGEDKNENQDGVDGRIEVFEEPMEIEGTEQTVPEDVADKDQSASVDESAEEIPATVQVPEENQVAAEKSTSSEEQGEGEDVPPERVPEAQPVPASESSETLIINDPSNLCEPESDMTALNKTNEDVSNVESEPPEPMEVDGKASQPQHEHEEETVADAQDDSIDMEKVQECDESQKDKENENEQHEEGKENLPAEPQIHHEEVSESASEFQHQSETSNSQSNDEDDNSQSSQDTAPSQENGDNSRNQSTINQTILDDWDDTDSQQSEKQRAAMKEAAENVNKLMDDWEEEEEEDKREAN